MKTRLRLPLTAGDSKRYLEHAVEVAPGTRALRVTLDFSPAVTDGVRNMLCLSVFGPEGFRGAGHRHHPGNAHEVVIGEGWATPGFLPGPVAPGTWTVEIDCHMIHGAAGCVAELVVETSSAPIPRPGGPGAAPPSREPPAAAALPPLPPGWLRGDIHAHSHHSDATWQVGDLIRAARGLGLDFVTLSDHNTVSGLTELTASDLVTVVGMELTTYHGHALALGLREWTDWRAGRGGRTMAEIANEVADRGGLFVIAHPRSAGDPTCTGCRWLYPDTSPGPARHVEIFNGGLTEDRNAEALELWYGWLDAGLEVYATAGTDAHHAGHMRSGRRFNVVRCRRRTPEAVLAALAAGRSYLSSGPHLTLAAVDAAGHRALPGGAVAAGDAAVDVSWRAAAPESTVRLVVDGRPRNEWAVEELAAAANATQGTTGRGAGGRRRAGIALAPRSWCLAELRAADGTLAAVTNPIRGRAGAEPPA